MKVAIIAMLSVLVGCSQGVEPGKVSPSPAASPEVEYPSDRQTMTEWVGTENAKKEKCSGSSYGGIEDEHHTWSKDCVNGTVVYTDITAQLQSFEMQQLRRRRELADALISRCLTADEFREVTGLGYMIYVIDGQPYLESDMQSRFNAALMTQQILRMHCPDAREARR